LLKSNQIIEEITPLVKSAYIYVAGPRLRKIPAPHWFSPPLLCPVRESDGGGIMLRRKIHPKLSSVPRQRVRESEEKKAFYNLGKPRFSPDFFLDIYFSIHYLYSLIVYLIV
jgi:hypothetical protein